MYYNLEERSTMVIQHENIFIKTYFLFYLNIIIDENLNINILKLVLPITQSLSYYYSHM